MESLTGDINPNLPGLIMHGIQEGFLGLNLGKVKEALIKGLTSPAQRGYPKRDMSNQYPNDVSLSLIGKHGYKSSSAALFGAGHKDVDFSGGYNPGFTFVIDPQFVETQRSDFIAVGHFFIPGSQERLRYTDEDGDLLHKLEFRGPNFDAFGDEVITGDIPPQALSYLLVESHARSVKRRILSELGDLNIPLYLVNGKVLQSEVDTK